MDHSAALCCTVGELGPGTPFPLPCPWRVHAGSEAIRYPRLSESMRRLLLLCSKQNNIQLENIQLYKILQ